MMQRIEGHSDLYKTDDGVIINRSGDREQYRRAKQTARAQIERESRVDEELDNLKNDINEIKSLLKQMLKQ